uniref:Uncharacterized protein n=1 Tax=Romanomermis culicivorax TaxID=13658 RepID=A0A915JXU6_ROMCU
MTDRSEGGWKTTLEYKHKHQLKNGPNCLALKLLKWGHEFLPPEPSASLDANGKALFPVQIIWSLEIKLPQPKSTWSIQFKAKKLKAHCRIMI